MIFFRRRAVSMIEYAITAGIVSTFVLGSVAYLGSRENWQFCTIEVTFNLAVNQSTDCIKSANYGIGAAYNSGVLPSTFGAACPAYKDLQYPGCAMADGQMLYNFNKMNPVTSIYGLKGNDGNPVTTYQDALTKAFGQGMNRQYGVNSPLGYYEYEMQTASGNTYGVFYGGDQGLGIRDLVTGKTLFYDFATGALKDGGYTNIHS